MRATITRHQCFYNCQVLSFIKKTLFIIPFFHLKSVATYIHTYILHSSPLGPLPPATFVIQDRCAQQF